jgi:hypothetical protein
MTFVEPRRASTLWQAWLVLLMGCSPPPPVPEGFQVVGTIRYVEIERGVYLIVAADSTRYQPLDLPEAFRKDGLRIRATLRREPDVMTVGQAGEPVSVIRVDADSGS